MVSRKTVIRSDAQTDLNLRCTHMPTCTLCWIPIQLFCVLYFGRLFVVWWYVKPQISHFVNFTPYEDVIYLRTVNFDIFSGETFMLKFHIFFNLRRTGTIFLRCEELVPNPHTLEESSHIWKFGIKSSHVENRYQNSHLWRTGTKSSYMWKIGTKLSQMWRTGT